MVICSSLRRELIEGLDLVVVRELTSGIYFGKPKEQRVSAEGVEEAIDTMLYREPESTVLPVSLLTLRNDVASASHRWINKTYWRPRAFGGESSRN
jgi:hypothetical protein